MSGVYCIPFNSKIVITKERAMYGDITQVDTSGASQITANQDRIAYSGVAASNTMAQTDMANVSKYIGFISQVARETGVDSCVICGIMSRETRANINILSNGGFGFDGCGYGLMQVDKRYHTLQGGPASIEHIRQATGILIEKIGTVQRMHSDWNQNMALKGGLSAYNMGEMNVKTYARVDEATTGGDYSNDVVARSQWFKRNGL